MATREEQLKLRTLCLAYGYKYHGFKIGKWYGSENNVQSIPREKFSGADFAKGESVMTTTWSNDDGTFSTMPLKDYVANEVKRELDELKKLGVDIPEKSYTLLKNTKEVEELYSNGMSITEIASHLIEVGLIK